MKKMKSAFTLAEVLITLGIIGVIAAIILPSVMANYQYKAVGVKLAKFLSTTEGAARAYAVNDGNFSFKAATQKGESNTENITRFINDTYIFKSFDPENGSDGTSLLTYPAVKSEQLAAGNFEEMEGDEASPAVTLKDGTSIQVYADSTSYSGDAKKMVAPEKYGEPVVRIRFNPQIQGLPKVARHTFDFSVTELGYVFPANNDVCTWALFNKNFSTTSADFQEKASCHFDTKNAAPKDSSKKN